MGPTRGKMGGKKPRMESTRLKIARVWVTGRKAVGSCWIVMVKPPVVLYIYCYPHHNREKLRCNPPGRGLHLRLEVDKFYFVAACPVSYTHLTLPTNREV